MSSSSIPPQHHVVWNATLVGTELHLRRLEGPLQDFFDIDGLQSEVDQAGELFVGAVDHLIPIDGDTTNRRKWSVSVVIATSPSSGAVAYVPVLRLGVGARGKLSIRSGMASLSEPEARGHAEELAAEIRAGRWDLGRRRRRATSVRDLRVLATLLHRAAHGMTIDDAMLEDLHHMDRRLVEFVVAEARVGKAGK